MRVRRRLISQRNEFTLLVKIPLKLRSRWIWERSRWFGEAELIVKQWFSEVSRGISACRKGHDAARPRGVDRARDKSPLA